MALFSDLISKALISKKRMCFLMKQKAFQSSEISHTFDLLMRH